MTSAYHRGEAGASRSSEGRPRGVAWGKVMLFGEYAVLERHSALLSATSHQASAQYQPFSELQERQGDDDLPWRKLSELVAEMNVSGMTPIYAVNAGPLGQMLIGTDHRSSSPNMISDPRDESRPSFSLDGSLSCLGVDLPFARVALARWRAPVGIYHIDTSRFGVQRGGHWEKMGIGSSGASTAALIHLLAQLPSSRDEINTPQQRFTAACDIHHRVQGRLGSGADIATSVYGGFIRYQGPPDRIITPLRYRLPDTWGLWSGGSASTVRAVKHVKAWASRERQNYLSCIERIADVERDAYRALSSTEPQHLWCEALKRGAEAARALGERAGVPIWTPRHQRWSQIVDTLGGAIKPSGAGGDDLSLFAAQDFESEQACLEALRRDAEFRGEELICFKLG